MLSLTHMNTTNYPSKNSKITKHHPETTLEERNSAQRQSKQNNDHYQRHSRPTPSPRMALNSILNQPSLYKAYQTSRGDVSSRKGSPKGKNSIMRMIEKRQVVGKGGFGKVWRVEHKGSGKSYALKQMSKALVIAKKSVPSVMNQKALLADLQNFFLVNLLHAHQDRQNLYLLLDYLPGGDLRHHLSYKRFNEQEAKFIIVCILLGLKYLHAKGVIHRDIKPQNIVLDSQGYAHITDLGVARPLRPNNSCDTSGTPGYMAPEVLCRQDHSYSVDHFAVGIMTYELMLRKRPLKGRSRKEIRQEVIARQPQIRRHEIPQNWSLEAGDFINRLIQRKPSQRLGHSSIQQIFRHPWLKNYPIDRVISRSIVSPWSPGYQGPSDSDFESSQQSQLRDLIAENELMLRKHEIQELFNGYDYQRPAFKLT